VFSPLAQGILTGKYRPGEAPEQGTRAADPGSSRFMQTLMNEEVLSAVDNLRSVAAEAGLSMSQLALAWALRQPNVSSAIIGASRPEQVEDNAGASDAKLSEDIIGEIDRILDGVVVRG
ncbi:MAG: aldo/keto reductase, partial [Actinomycetota bacterium]|nr:aldo/keto reductase [Actinomycetota bacterium]